MKPQHPNLRRVRARGALVILGVLTLVLLASFFRSQVVRGTAWALQSESNRLRVMPVPAPRGTIFDRYGEIISDNVPSYSLSLFPAPVDSIAESLHRLQPHLALSDERVEELIESFLSNRRFPLLVKSNLNESEVAAMAELRPEFPGAFLETRPRRRYIHGPALGHVLGYVGEVSQQELESPRFEGYERGMILGKDGLERQYEELLQGAQGIRYVEVDALGRVVGSFEGHSAAPTIPGEDIHLHLDLGLQNYIHEIFPDSMRGAVVALDPDDGGILALYSAPSYDPTDFVGGISRQRWEELNTDPDEPLFNRAVMGLYPPASTWKLATAAIAMDLGVLDPGEVMPVPCTGSFQFQNVRRRCWNPNGHGYQDLAGAVAQSCNVYFYQVGVRIGLERLVHEGTRFGFGEPCGVDLPREQSGRFPESMDFWQRTWGYRAAENEVLSLAIGQGPNDQTPLKMAQFYLALALGEGAPAPRLRRPVPGEEPGPAWSLDLGPEHVAELQRSLREVTASGTANLSTLEHWDLIGKTGTAQHRDLTRDPHAWFAGMAGPFGGTPEIVIVVIVEEGDSGSSVAAPIAAKAADFHLRRKYGMELDSIQTLREHLEAGVPAPWAWERQSARNAPAPEAPDDDEGGTESVPEGVREP